MADLNTAESSPLIQEVPNTSGTPFGAVPEKPSIYTKIPEPVAEKAVDPTLEIRNSVTNRLTEIGISNLEFLQLLSLSDLEKLKNTLDTFPAKADSAAELERRKAKILESVDANLRIDVEQPIKTQIRFCFRICEAESPSSDCRKR